MRIFRAALVIVGLPLAIMTIFHQTDFNPPLPAAHAQAPPDSPPSPTAVDPASSSRAPRYVTLWIKKSLDTLVT